MAMKVRARVLATDRIQWVPAHFLTSYPTLFEVAEPDAVQPPIGVPPWFAAAVQEVVADAVGAPRLKVVARDPEQLIVGTVTRNADGAATSAPVVWPDGTPGTYTADEVSEDFPGAVDAYHITYGSPATKTYTQPAVTRDDDGAVISAPAIVET